MIIQIELKNYKKFTLWTPTPFSLDKRSEEEEKYPQMTSELERSEKESWKRFFKFLAEDVKQKIEGIAKTYLESEGKSVETKEPVKKSIA